LQTDRVAKPFQIGIRPLDPADWLDVDGQLGAYLAEKERLLADARAAVFAAEPGTEDAQADVLGLVADYLPSRFPEVYRAGDGGIDLLGLDRRISLGSGESALVTAARLVQEDLVLMRRGAEHWRLAAAVLCFPSAWRLSDKIGRPMHEVHGPVPGFGAATRNAGMIERMFDNLRPEMPVIRWNWSLFGDDRLHHPEASHPDRPRFGDNAETAFLRVERQTLRRLPFSGDILFTIRIYVDPIEALGRSDDGRTTAAAIMRHLDELSAEQLEYKGLLREREVLVRRLREIAGA
jgi:hypothetical protein